MKRNNVVLFTDTDTDITPAVAKEYDYNLIIMPYYINGEEFKPYLDTDSFDFKKYYDMLRKGVMPKTNALSPIDYKNYFEPIFKEGKDILYVHFSKAMSGTFNSMSIAYEELKETYPDRKLYTIDCKGITLNAYIMVRYVGELWNKGLEVDEIIKKANEEADHFASYLFVDNLSFFSKSGRVKSLAAFMGNIIGVKPIIYFDDDGMMNPITKVRGTINAINKIVEYVESLQDNIKNYPIIIGHSDSLKLVEMLKSKLKERFGNLKIEVVEVNPTAGAHCGPDGVGISFHAIHR